MIVPPTGILIVIITSLAHIHFVLKMTRKFENFEFSTGSTRQVALRLNVRNSGRGALSITQILSWIQVKEMIVLYLTLLASTNDSNLIKNDYYI